MQNGSWYWVGIRKDAPTIWWMDIWQPDIVPEKTAKNNDQLPANPQANQVWQIGAAPGIDFNMNNNEFSMYYPQLYPTPNNKYCHATYNDNDFADDEKVCMSTVKEKCADDTTATTEELTSNEESSQEGAYIPRTKNIIYPTILSMPNRNKAWKK